MDPLLVRLRARARVARDRLVNQDLLQLERLRRGLSAGKIDVLLLGDSSCFIGRPGEPDDTKIPDLLARRLGVRVGAFAGSGFSAPMYAEVLRVLGTLDRRPRAVVTTICVRTSTSTHVLRHPIYAHEQSYEAIRRLDSAHCPIRPMGGVGRPSAAEYARFEALTVQTRWGGESTIGAFRRQLKGQGPMPWPEALDALLFDYLHGELLEPDNQGLVDWRRCGEQIRQYGVRTVGYQSPIAVNRGVSHFGHEFADFAAHKRRLVASAVAQDAGPDLELVDPILDDDDFAVQRDGTEHYAYSGRRKVVEAIVAALGD
jgi:hypothetical protein